MATLLKDIFDEAEVRRLASEVAAAYPALDEARFVRDGLAGLEPLTLTGRAGHLAETLRRHLPQPFEDAADVIVRSLGTELASSTSFGLSPLRYMPHVFFVSRFGLDHFEESMQAQYELTKRFSAEWSIRAFLEKHPERTYARLERWTTDPDVHVRRLVSEGTRPRLPWAPRLRAFQRDPSPVIALLERLKDDPELYVRRSVANNLNDIGKDHPERLAELCARWSEDATPERRWIVKHALRSLVKRGDPAALALHGTARPPEVSVERVRVSPKRAPIGGAATIGFELASTSDAPQTLMVDYVVHYVKASGDTRPKVFKLRKLALEPGERVSLTARLSFAQMTTRKHYAGKHRVELMINGALRPLGEITLVS